MRLNEKAKPFLSYMLRCACTLTTHSVCTPVVYVMETTWVL